MILTIVSNPQTVALTIAHVNRKGKTYYLHQGKTKTGKPKFFFSLKSTGSLVDTIPEGDEIYENLNAQVFLRKILLQIVMPTEVATVRHEMKRHAKIKHYIIDVKGKNIVVYLCDQNVDALMAITAMGLTSNTAKVLETLLQATTYSPMMQLRLSDKKTENSTLNGGVFEAQWTIGSA